MDIHRIYSNHMNTSVDEGRGSRLPIRRKNIPSFIDYRSWCKHDTFRTSGSPDTVFFASDHHFDHKNIIKYANRPFNDVEQMNEVLIERHNEVVGVDDVCVFGGDIGFGSTDKTNKHLSRMNGYKIFVLGNHDFNRSRAVKEYDVDEGHLFWEVMGMIEDFRLIFTHYPINDMPSDVINLHGHIHDRLSSNPQHINLCVEHTDYRPVVLSEVIETAKLRLIDMQG